LFVKSAVSPVHRLILQPALRREQQAWQHTLSFNALGTIGYYCGQHGGLTTAMRGSISVIDRVSLTDSRFQSGKAGTVSIAIDAVRCAQLACCASC
jgi:hypothetical protein